MKSAVFGLAALTLCVTVGACRKKDRPNVLGLIPEDAPLVAWMPEPKASLDGARAFLAVFEQENLGDQLKTLRFEWKKQYGVDPLDEKTIAAVGLDLTKPWALAYGRASNTPLYFLAAHDPGTFLAYFKKVMADGWLITEAQTKSAPSGKIYVFAQPFGNATIEVAALRLGDDHVAIASGSQASAALAAWPSADAFSGKDGAPKSFQKAWKRAESDGSAAGAALRVVAKDSAQVLPAILAQRFAKAEVRAALSLKANRAELFTTLLGAGDVRPLLAQEKTFAPGVGLPDKPVMVARSQLNANELFAIATSLRLLQPLYARAGIDEKRIADLLALGTGAGAFAVELVPQALKNAGGRTALDRLRVLLDAFPVTAIAELKQAEAFDAALGTLEGELKQRGFAATLDKSNKLAPVLKTASITPGSQVSLSRRANTLIYGIGPGAFSSAVDRVTQQKGMTRAHPVFGPLFEPYTSGMIVDVAALVTSASVLPEIIFGDQNALMKSFFGSTLKSFAHFQQAGATLGLEGPAYEPHPVLRLWLTTK
ncbi:MAG: hypothetical protein IT381_02375 [Deltaproteobacteria bacterium]|nr:hypothetical protein [Deltaproteobacteria bacterium]